MRGPGCLSVTSFSGVQCFALLACPLSCPEPGLPALLSLLSHHPPFEPGGVDCDPSQNLDWNLLSRTGASTLAKNWGTEPPGEPCPGPVAHEQGHSQGSWEERETPHCLLGGPSCSASLYLRNSSLSHPPQRWGDQESAPSRGKSEGGPFPSDPVALCRVLHQQDPFQGLRGSPRSPPLPAPNVPAASWGPCHTYPRAWGCWEPKVPQYQSPHNSQLGGHPPPGNL